MTNERLAVVVREAWLNAQTESHVIDDIVAAIVREFYVIDKKIKDDVFVDVPDDLY